MDSYRPLTSYRLEPDVTNTFAEPERITPVRSTIRLDGTKLEFKFPAYSLTVLRFNVTGR